MMQPEKTGVIGGIIGATIGGILWLVIGGISIKSPFIIFIALVWGGICILGVSKLYDKHPERKFAILGIALLWLVVLNFVLGNILYDKIPYSLGGISTGKAQFSFINLNIFLGFMSILGFYFLIKDIIGKKGEYK